jgi:PspA associated protein B
VGLLDVLRGKRELKKPASDRLFAMATAYVTLETSLGMKTAGAAAIVFQKLDTADFATLAKDMQELVSATTAEAGTVVETREDSFGYQWMILRDADFEDLVTGINAISGELEVGGYGDRILAAVFPFEDEAGKRVYWIYNYKRGAFYPFVPAGGEQQRDNERELRLKAQIGPELPLEPELERWFPLWDIPL